VAIYHLSVKAISRSAGRSVVAAAAYRAGQELTDERQGLTHDYTRKQGVEDAFIVAPDGADWAQDRNALWNAAEAAEKRKDAKTGREYELALPAELGAGERKELARDFARELVARYGVVADVAIHEPGREGDNRNHHAHILTTTRTAGGGWSGGQDAGSGRGQHRIGRDRAHAGGVGAPGEHGAGTAPGRAASGPPEFRAAGEGTGADPAHGGISDRPRASGGPQDSRPRSCDGSREAECGDP